MSGHYQAAKRHLGNRRDARAQVEATLYLGEQVEALAGILSQAERKPYQLPHDLDAELRREEAGGV